MSIDVIICTYNRAEKVNQLVSQLLHLENSFARLIVIDSSDQNNNYLVNTNDVTYIRSNHKNQPYQRYLGHLISNADYLLYLDDDMEIIHSNLLGILNNIIVFTAHPDGIALAFKDRHSTNSLSVVSPKSTLNAKQWYLNCLHWFTGYPKLGSGKLGYCGNRGPQPKKLAKTEYVSGGSFLARRDAIFKNFNFQLFDLFEEKLGMGEDALLGYGLHKQGNLYFYPVQLFWHNDSGGSHYAKHQLTYAKKVLFSRLYLSLEKSRLDNKYLLFAYLHYHWYALWRIIGYINNYIRDRSEERKSVLIGSYQGWLRAMKFKYNNRNEFWILEAKKLLDS